MLNRVLARCACLLAALPFALPVWGEEQGGRRIEEVIVTAEKREASIQDTSISITAFTGEFLDDFGIRNQEDLQNFIPATTIQPYDATVRGVGRNFRALGGDPGVSTYMNGIYSEDLLTATAATFFDVERVEILRGPQGTLFGRNAVGGAVNILYKEPSQEWEGMVRAIAGNFGTQEYYGALSGPIIRDKLAARVTLAYRDRDGVIDDIGPNSGGDVDGLGTESYAAQFLFTPTDNFEMKLRMNQMDIDRSFGGANGGGLVILNEGQGPGREFDAQAAGFRPVDLNNTAAANVFQNNFFDQGAPTFQFTNPLTGNVVTAQRNRLGIDAFDGVGFINAASSLDSFGVSSPQSRQAYNNCVFNGGNIDGDDICAATNGFNVEEFEQNGYQFSTTWDINDNVQVKYLFGFNTLSYERITDDDNTASPVIDRQFYVNHEADYRSHELQVLWNLRDNISVTSGAFFYNAEIDQRGDFYDSTGNRFVQPYQDNTGIVAAVFGTFSPTLFTAQAVCQNNGFTTANCQRNSGNNNLVIGPFQGDNGNDLLNVRNGDLTRGTDLLYTTETKREAYAFYTQFAWDINEDFTLTVGGRYASDEVVAEENLWRYDEVAPALFNGVLPINLATFNLANGGLVPDGNGGFTPTINAVNALPVALSVFRSFDREDKEWGWRFNLDYHVTDNALVYLGATRAHRSGGYNLVFFSNTATYDPEELINYELGYKTDWFDNTLQINGSFYYYDYETIHTVGTEVSSIGGLTTSVLPAPGARVIGIESEFTWLATDNLTMGGNFSFTPSEYTESLAIADPSRAEVPPTLSTTLAPPDPNNPTGVASQAVLLEDIEGNQLLQVPEWKATIYSNYRFILPGSSNLDLRATWAYTGEVFYSPFERDQEKAEAYDRLDLRATWTSAERNITVSAFVNNVMNDIGILQVLRQGENEYFRHTLGTTVPRAYGIELSYQFGDY